jgi:hypothetical protein
MEGSGVSAGIGFVCNFQKRNLGESNQTESNVMREGWRACSLDSDFAFEIAGLQGGKGGVSNITWGIRMQDHDLTGDRHTVPLKYTHSQICVFVSSLHSPRIFRFGCSMARIHFEYGDL